MQRASGIPHALLGREIYQRLGRIARRGRERVFDSYERATFPVVIARQRVGRMAAR